ncbi:hypothetical protein BZG36_03023 [Bifiguratus adelaidae]|uniref:Tr-type G domain-containing protein n=1 Tax=Bifiguratus adelaidae TaxID=1938954 RepID=A0A261XZP7_9FUNG|nr:hypothetical protein BZG36_03023 [Bifiguratus adelaidae]
MSLNVNVGIVGHVDAGKTTIAKALSTVASTAAFDKHPQSQQRGITLDLGFSSFTLDLCDDEDTMVTTSKIEPNAYIPPKPKQVQVTLVDCPGHASLLRTIIGGAQIIDMMILVIDATKGVQAQTAECLMIAEITTQNMIIVLNKLDLLPMEGRAEKLEKLTKGLRKALANTKFADAAIVPVCGRAKADVQNANGNMDALIKEIRRLVPFPQQSAAGPFLFAIDHCFTIKGQGTILTGTVLRGSIKLGENIAIAGICERKVKTMQSFRKPVQSAKQGDRVGICVPHFDSDNVERGLAFTPGTVKYAHAAIIDVHKVRVFKRECYSRSKIHVTVGYATTTATITFFSGPSQDDFNAGKMYLYEGGLQDDQPDKSQWALLEFDHPVEAPDHALVIGSRLDMDISLNTCRLAFHGHLRFLVSDKDYQLNVLPKLKIYKLKEKTGMIDRIVDNETVIVKNMFKKDSDVELFLRMNVSVITGATGYIESRFGQGGKVKVRFDSGVPDCLHKPAVGIERNADKVSKSAAQSDSSIVLLRYKKFVYDKTAKITQGDP